MNTIPAHLFEHHHIVVDPQQTTMRIDQFLVTRIAFLTRTRLQAAMQQGYVRIDEKIVKPSYKIKPHDNIKVLLPKPPRNHKLITEKIPLNIVYEDDHLLVVNKPAEQVVHPGIGNWSGTLANGLAYYLHNLPHYAGNETRPGILHRLDKGTSGLIAIAKTVEALNGMTPQFIDHSIQRIYYALVWGEVKEDAGTINKAIGRSVSHRKKMVIYEDEDQQKAKKAITHYKVIERLGYVSLIECQLETGRTHQIRAHMSFIKHPIFNDLLYGGAKVLKGQQFSKYKSFVHNCFALLPYQALHAKSLTFYHPVQKKHMTLQAPLPTGFQAILDKWRKYMRSL